MAYQNPAQIPNFYVRLGVSTSASADEIKARYRTLALQWHPDRNKGSQEATRAMQALSEAYTTLSDPLKRRSYDFKNWRNPNREPKRPNPSWAPTAEDFADLVRKAAKDFAQQQRREREKREKKEKEERQKREREAAEAKRKADEEKRAREEMEMFKKRAEELAAKLRREQAQQTQRDKTFDEIVGDLEQTLNENIIKPGFKDFLYNNTKEYFIYEDYLKN